MDAVNLPFLGASILAYNFKDNIAILIYIAYPWPCCRPSPDPCCVHSRIYDNAHYTAYFRLYFHVIISHYHLAYFLLTKKLPYAILYISLH